MSPTNKIPRTFGVLALLGLAACSSTKPSGASSGSGGADAQAATGGARATGGVSAIGGATSGSTGGSTDGVSSGGGIGTGGESDADTKTPLECGGVVCAPKYTPPCCTGVGTGEPGNKLEFGGRAANRCGTDLSQYSAGLDGICLQLNQPGVLDTSCPDSANPSPGGAALKGCCTDQGFCGAYEGVLALGCEYAGKRGKPCGKNADAGADANVGDASKH